MTDVAPEKARDAAEEIFRAFDKNGTENSPQYGGFFLSMFCVGYKVNIGFQRFFSEGRYG